MLLKMFLITFCFLFTPTAFSTESSSHEFTVVIDPGHGGIDAGAVRDVFKESNITLQIAEKIKNLTSLDPQLKIILTRETNTSLSLEKRVSKAEENKADLFISLHANSSTAVNVTGMEFYFKKGLYAPRYISQSTDAPTSPTASVKKIISDLIDFGHTKQSLKFNQLLQNQLLSELPDSKTVIKRAPYYVIEKTTMPSVLIEVGYISNLSEAKELLTDERQQKIAETIVKAIVDFKHDIKHETHSKTQ